MQALSDLIKEPDVYKRFPGVFSEDELRLARTRDLIAFYPLGRSFYYTEADLVAYVQSKKVDPACKERNAPLSPDKEMPSSSSETTGSTASRAEPTSTVIGMTPALEKRAAKLLSSLT